MEKKELLWPVIDGRRNFKALGSNKRCMDGNICKVDPQPESLSKELPGKPIKGGVPCAAYIENGAGHYEDGS